MPPPRPSSLPTLDDGNVIHFTNPKVQAAIAANTFSISGTGEHKELSEMLPGILNQLGPDSLNSLKRLAETYQPGVGAPVAEAADDADEDSDDDVPGMRYNCRPARCVLRLLPAK